MIPQCLLLQQLKFLKGPPNNRRFPSAWMVQELLQLWYHVAALGLIHLTGLVQFGTLYWGMGLHSIVLRLQYCPTQVNLSHN